MTYHAKTPQQTMADLSSSVRGLDDTVVAERLERYGPNIIRVVRRTTVAAAHQAILLGVYAGAVCGSGD